MSKKWKKLWTDAIVTVFISIICTVIALGAIYFICWLAGLIYEVLIGG